MIQVSQEEYEQEHTRDPLFLEFMIETGRVKVTEGRNENE